MTEDKLKIHVNGIEHVVAAGRTVAVALLQTGTDAFRRSATGEPRGPLCGMGICFECRATVNGIAHTRTCMTLVAEAMDIKTD